MPSQVLSQQEQTNLWNSSANPNASVGGVNCKTINWGPNVPWANNPGPACWNWALAGGSAGTPNDYPDEGTQALKSLLNNPVHPVRPTAGPWAVNNQQADAVLTAHNLQLPNGCAWGVDGVRVPSAQVNSFTTWFYNVCEALSKHQAESNGFQVTAVATPNLNALGVNVTAAHYYIFMYPEFGVVPQSGPDQQGRALYKAPVFDHWWVQVPATANHFVSIETITNNPLRLYRDTRIWAGNNKRVAVMTVDGLHPTMHAVLGILQVI